MRIICHIYKDCVWQLNVFLPCSCHICASEMSLGWGHLNTWMDPCVGHLIGILAWVGGNLNNNFQKSRMPGRLPGAGGGCWHIIIIILGSEVKEILNQTGNFKFGVHYTWDWDRRLQKSHTGACILQCKRGLSLVKKTALFSTGRQCFEQFWLFSAQIMTRKQSI